MGVAPSIEEINRERNQTDRGKTVPAIREDTIQFREMDGTSSRECAAFPRRKNSCLANDLTTPRRANKNLSAREWLVITSYLYIIVAIQLGRSSRRPVVANRNWGTSIAKYRLLEKLEFRDLKESKSTGPSCLDNFMIELSVFRCISFV